MAKQYTGFIRTCDKCTRKTEGVEAVCRNCGADLPPLPDPVVDNVISDERRSVHQRSALVVFVLAGIAALSLYFHYVFLPESRVLNDLRNRISSALEERRWSDAERVANEIMEHHPDKARTYLRHIHDSRVLAERMFEFSILRTFQLHQAPVVAVIAAPDTQHALSQSSDGQLLQWTLNDGTVAEERSGVPTTPTSSVFTPTGRLMLTTQGRTESCALVEFPSGRERVALPHRGVEIRALGISADGRIGLTADTSGNIRVWRLNNGEMIRMLPTDTLEITSLGFSLDKKYILAGTDDGRISIWGVL